MIKYLFALYFTLCPWLLNAHEAHTEHQHSSLAVSVAFDAQGQLWRASVNGGHVTVAHSADLGKTFSKPVVVNKNPQKIGADSEARPKIAITVHEAEQRRKQVAEGKDETHKIDSYLNYRCLSWR